jgi:hypothetical protein
MDENSIEPRQTQQDTGSLDKAAASTDGAKKPNVARYFLFLLYTLPLLVVLAAGRTVQNWVVESCLALPVADQGECGAGWLQILIIPATTLALIVACLMLLAGLIHVTVTFSLKVRANARVLIITLGVLLTIILPVLCLLLGFRFVLI